MYEMDETADRELAGEVDKKRRIFGILCPKKNRSGDICKECNRSELLWNQGSEENKNLARRKFSKPSFFVTAMLEDGTFMIIKLGKKVSKEILDEFENYSGWGFADPEKGSWVRISKHGSDPNFEYRFRVLPEEAPAVSKERMNTLPVVEAVKEGYFEGKYEVLDIAHYLQPGNHLKFRILPTRKENGKFKKMAFEYYHWQCTEADILGGLDESESFNKDEDLPTDDYSEFMDNDSTASSEPEGYTPPASGLDDYDEGEDSKIPSGAPQCFSNFDADPTDCLAEGCDEWREACVQSTNSKLHTNWRRNKKNEWTSIS